MKQPRLDGQRDPSLLRPQSNAGANSNLAQAGHSDRLDPIPYKQHGQLPQGRLFQTFERALGIDIRPVLNDSQVYAFLHNKQAENIGYIRTIPKRMHKSLFEDVRKTFQDAPFDKKKLSDIVAKNYGSSGYNVRPITKDQTSKTMG